MTTSKTKYFLAAAGVFMLLGSLVVYEHTASFVHRATRTQGTVTALVRHQSVNYSNTNGSIGNRSTIRYSYQPVVQFQYGSQHIQFSDSVASNPPAYHVGETVNVLYLESDPYEARIDSFTSLWFLPMLFGGMGAIFLAVGTGMIFGSRTAAG
jgi:hypothetical protein